MDYIVCPFNSDHQVRGTELRMHLMTCQSKQENVQPGVSSQQTSKKKTKWIALSLKQDKEEEARRWDQEIYVYSPHDPERPLQCPYDANHKIRACRFPYHLVKCRNNHPALASQLVTCPFNARHLIPRGELSFHISRCDDKSCIEKDIADEQSAYCPEVKPSNWTAPPCSENWDEEADDSRSPFIWGTPSYPVPR
ncbi:gametocyte-specific factor 1 [Pyxicephalus adspersus]|uniref:gametocyte-specific factor 1 n=1 Tax=Pyxicephalus adspersus TaxID=30357 RepID=UPI003B5A4275